MDNQTNNPAETNGQPNQPVINMQPPQDSSPQTPISPNSVGAPVVVPKTNMRLMIIIICAMVFVGIVATVLVLVIPKLGNKDDTTQNADSSASTSDTDTSGGDGGAVSDDSDADLSKKVQIVDHVAFKRGYTTAEYAAKDYISDVAVVIKNDSNVNVSLTYNVTFYDSNDTKIDSSYEYLYLSANSEFVQDVYCYSCSDGTDGALYSYHKIEDFSVYSDSDDRDYMNNAVQASVTKGASSNELVTTIVNKSDKTIDTLAVTTVLYKGDKIVLAFSRQRQNLSPGKTIEMDRRQFGHIDFDDYKVFVNAWNN
ncbi:MAG: hypothetical protein LBQ02_01520 [Candidatus Nomurabacteria bacterium]|jgi:hypothetical protein|nr:hypothetical protein [Candidatus Nomurabacteria bacterium]